jgi:hypothetical protein
MSWTPFNAHWLTSTTWLRDESQTTGVQTKRPKRLFRPLREKLAATYSRGVYKTTTIGKTVFDGRVRNGNGSDHSFMATKKSFVKTIIVLNYETEQNIEVLKSS